MLVWLDGDILPADQARVGVLDRGFLFGDGVYEVVRIVRGVPIRLPLHVERLRRSLEATRIGGFDPALLGAIVGSLVTAEGLADATVYVQVTRGAMSIRRHLPDSGMRPTVVAFAAPARDLDELATPLACRASLLPELRWRRCDIKATSLLGSVLALMDADDAGADEAIFFSPPRDGAAAESGLVGEGATSNVWASIDGVLVTPPVDDEPPILHGVTRAAALTAADRHGVPVRVERLTVAELRRAPEILLTSARRFVAAVVELDGVAVGDGAVGPLAVALATAMRRDVEAAIESARTGAATLQR